MRDCLNTDKPGKFGYLVHGAGCVLVGASLLLQTGCSTTKPHAKGDPLVGEIHPPGGAPNSPVPPNPASHSKSAAVPPIPSTQGPVTNASLASLDGGRSLAIGSNTPVSGGQPASYVTPANMPPVSPSPGGPKVMPLPRDTSPPAVATTGSVSANQQTNDLLQAQLKARGVIFQKQDSVPDGVKFVCIVPVPGSNDNQFFEATARDYPTAVQAVIFQIDQQKKK